MNYKITFKNGTTKVLEGSKPSTKYMLKHGIDMMFGAVSIEPTNEKVTKEDKRKEFEEEMAD